MSQTIQNLTENTVPLQREFNRATELRAGLVVIWNRLQGLPDLLTKLTAVPAPGQAGQDQDADQANQPALTAKETIAAFRAFHVLKGATTGANGNQLDGFGQAIAALKALMPPAAARQ